MKKSWLKYLWILGLLGLLGLFTSNKGFYGFFGFFGFISLYTLRSDERLESNINKSARNAFLAGILIFILAMVVTAFTADISLFKYAFILSFALQIFVFIVSLKIYDHLLG